MVEYHPISSKNQSRLHQFGATILARYVFRFCIKRDGNLERRHYGRRHWRIGGDGRIGTPRQKAQCKGRGNAAKKWKFHIPSRRWNSQKYLEEDSIWEHPPTRNRPERREEQDILQGKSDELHSPTPLQEDSTRDAEEAENDFWTITGGFIYRHRVVPRVKLHVPKDVNTTPHIQWKYEKRVRWITVSQQGEPGQKAQWHRC